MTRRPSPFATRFTARNASAFAFRLQHEITIARENIYNGLRARMTMFGPDDFMSCPIELIRSAVQTPMYEKFKQELNFADQLWRAQVALTEAQGLLK